MFNMEFEEFKDILSGKVDINRWDLLVRDLYDDGFTPEEAIETIEHGEQYGIGLGDLD